MGNTAQIQAQSNPVIQTPPISGLLDYSIAFFIIYSVAKELWQTFIKEKQDDTALLKLLIDDLRVNNREGFDKIVTAVLSMKDAYRTQEKELEVFINSSIKEQTVLYSQQIGELNRVNLAVHTRLDDVEKKLDSLISCQLNQ